jgi:uncharacterized protein (DUF433 family)
VSFTPNRHESISRKNEQISSILPKRGTRLNDLGNAMSDLMDRITINPEQCGGRPCIRGMRIRVIDVLDLFAAGLTAEQILEEMPDLEKDDLQVALQYAD